MLHFNNSSKLNSNLDKSLNLVAPSASANSINAPLAFWTPYKYIRTNVLLIFALKFKMDTTY